MARQTIDFWVEGVSFRVRRPYTQDACQDTKKQVTSCQDSRLGFRELRVLCFIFQKVTAYGMNPLPK